MKWRHFLSQIQRPDSDNNVPGLKAQLQKRDNENFTPESKNTKFVEME